MSNAKHTPGPWEVNPEEVGKDYIRIRGSVPGGRFKIANVLTPVYPGCPDRETSETRANARLIAAAPELLDILREIVATDIPLEYGFLEQARAVIAKAEGSESK